MPRLINVTDVKKRDAQVAMESPPAREATRFVGPAHQKVVTERLIKATDGHLFDALLLKHGGDAEALAKAMVAGDPEIDLERLGQRLDNADRVWVRRDGTVLYAARVLQVVNGPDGVEKSRQEFADVEATVREDAPLPWTGRLFDPREVVSRFVLSRTLRLHHVNGLTFDFLYEMAKTLQESGKLLFLGAGPKGALPLILQTNGTPYRGFLDGRIDPADGENGGDGYLLRLHLSNLELKAVPT